MSTDFDRAIAGAPVATKDERKFEHSESGDKASIHSVSDRIRTVEQALAHGEVDTAVWEVEKFTVNSWEAAAKVERDGEWRFETVTLWQVKVWLRRKVAKPLVDAASELFARFQGHKPLSPKPPKRKTNRHLLEVSPTDLHFGKLAWGKETGQDYDSSIAERVLANGVHDLLTRAAPFPVERIELPVGSDYWHVNSWKNTTVKGTPVEADGRLQRVWTAGCMAMVHAIDRCLTVAPVTVRWVKGNHDEETSFYLAQFLAAWFRANKHVEVDLSPAPRKYIVYGPALIGLTHGDKEKYDRLPQIMAVEKPTEWAAASHREWHVGHGHRSRSRRTWDGDEFEGVRVRMLPSLCATDGWHATQGYIGSRRCVEGYLWHQTDGYTGHLSVNARD